MAESRASRRIQHESVRNALPNSDALWLRHRAGTLTLTRLANSNTALGGSDARSMAALLRDRGWIFELIPAGRSAGRYVLRQAPCRTCGELFDIAAGQRNRLCPEHTPAEAPEPWRGEFEAARAAAERRRAEEFSRVHAEMAERNARFGKVTLRDMVSYMKQAYNDG